MSQQVADVAHDGFGVREEDWPEHRREHGRHRLAPGHADLTPRSVVRVAMTRYAIGTLAVLMLLVSAALWLGTTVAREQRLEESQVRSQRIADQLVAPLLTDVTVGSRSEERELLARLLTSRIEDGSLVRVKIWRPDGTILWSDDPSLVGKDFKLDREVRSLFGTHDAVSEVASLESPENVQERDAGSLIEVYAGTTAASGHPVVFEAYLPADELTAASRTLIAVLLAMSVGALVLFAAAAVPLGLSLARRVERAQRQHANLIRHGLLASDLERRRIAADLHDSVIPDLAAVVYLLPVLEDRVKKNDAAEASAYLGRVRSIVSRNITALRSALVDVHPPDLARDGLEVALQDMADEVGNPTLHVDVHVPADWAAGPMTEQLVYRVAREGLRNVVKHAAAGHAEIAVGASEGTVTVVVSDDGVGPEHEAGGGLSVPVGHLGLRLLSDTLRDLGGSLELTAGIGGGARLEARFPLVPDAG